MDKELVSAATIVVRALQRQRLRDRIPQEQAAKPARDPAGKFSHRTRDRKGNDFNWEHFAGAAAQAPHATPPELSDPDIDLALRYAEHTCGFRTRPPVDQDALDNQRAAPPGLCETERKSFSCCT